MTDEPWHQYRKDDSFIEIEFIKYVNDSGKTDESYVVSHTNAFPSEVSESSPTGKVTIWPEELLPRVLKNDTEGLSALKKSLSSWAKENDFERY